MELLDSCGNGDYFLDDFSAYKRGDAACRRTREKDTVLPGRQSVLLFEPLKEVERLLPLFRIVALVGLACGASLIIDKNVLAGRAADVHSADHFSHFSFKPRASPDE